MNCTYDIQTRAAIHLLQKAMEHLWHKLGEDRYDPTHDAYNMLYRNQTALKEDLRLYGDMQQ